MTTPPSPETLSVEAARMLALQAIVPVAETERVALHDALGRVLADAVTSPLDVPAYDNAAMDGYAFAGAALARAAGAELALPVAGIALAGHPHAGPLPPGACIRIMTGAPLPAGSDTVIAQERTNATDTLVRFAANAVTPGANCRRAGEDLARGAIVLEAGRIVRPADLGLLASLGIGHIEVRRRLRVACLSTGDELRAPGEPLGAGGRYDSNRATLYGMLAALGVDVLDGGIVRDDPAALEAALREAAMRADVVITSGGVSVGDADFTRELLGRLGEIRFANLAMRPGRPLACGRFAPPEPGARAALFFGLPGNPVAVAATFQVIVRDALLAMMGARAEPAPRYPARTSAAIDTRAGRTDFLRGVASREPDGAWRVAPAGSQSSASLKGLSDANCFIVVGADLARVEAGDSVEILPFAGAL
ncbi:gephyrin-like molybdotransferase Glp [Burkholderia glumae]|uniref:molybdopterin molybdotransferase MoeA n=1 Tax=Burkholderia glumae TaxID=337 RepID=UPI00215090E2|nr:gephyrin-like molybdotransferase Glp [Burkholderia glumae]UVS95207.1 molybdopterin molybdenumtransferase MoeA [Burkholderia glumae]